MQTTQSLKEISPAELRQRMAEGRCSNIIDVRTRPERDSVSIPGTRSIPLDELSGPAVLQQRVNVGEPIYLLCQSGTRAAKAAGLLEKAGIDDCVCIKGGIQGWMDAGFPVERGHSNVLPLQRQVQLVIGIVSATGAALALTINPKFAILPLVTGLGLIFAGLTGTCGLALLLARMPWNKTSTAKCCSTASNPKN